MTDVTEEFTGLLATQMLVFHSPDGMPRYSIEGPILPEIMEWHQNKSLEDPDYLFIETENGDFVNKWVVDGALVPRPEMTLGGVESNLAVDEEMIITGIEPGATVVVDNDYMGFHALGEETSLELSFAVAGTYNVRIIRAPYLDTVLEVVVG